MNPSDVTVSDWVTEPEPELRELEDEEILVLSLGAVLAERGGVILGLVLLVMRPGGGPRSVAKGVSVMGYVFVETRRSIEEGVEEEEDGEEDATVDDDVAVLEGDFGDSVIIVVSRVTKGGGRVPCVVEEDDGDDDDVVIVVVVTVGGASDDLLEETGFELRRSTLSGGTMGDGPDFVVLVGSKGAITPWILVIAYQSAALIYSYSLDFGGRQHPGQPGFLQALSGDASTFGLRFAH